MPATAEQSFRDPYSLNMFKSILILWRWSRAVRALFRQKALSAVHCPLCRSGEGKQDRHTISQKEFICTKFLSTDIPEGRRAWLNSRALWKKPLFYRELFSGCCTLSLVSSQQSQKLAPADLYIWTLRLHNKTQKNRMGYQSSEHQAFLEVRDIFASRLTALFISATQRTKVRRLCTKVSAPALHAALHSFTVCDSTCLSAATASIIQKEEVLSLQKTEEVHLLRARSSTARMRIVKLLGIRMK